MAIEFVEVESMDDDEGPSFDGYFSIGMIGTSGDKGKRGYCVMFDGLCEGHADDEPAARLAAVRHARKQLAETIAELDLEIAELERSAT